jgi:hypothetical protein
LSCEDCNIVRTEVDKQVDGRKALSLSMSSCLEEKNGDDVDGRLVMRLALM